MNTRKIILLSLAAVLLFTPALAQKELKGKKAPDFTLEEVTGKAQTLSDYRGTPVMLYFWSRY